MRISPRSSARLAGLGLLVLGVLRGATSIATAAPKRLCSGEFVPYIYADDDLVAWATKTGTKTFTLAFVVDDGNGHPSWGFAHESIEADTKVAKSLAALRVIGGDAIISFGGWDEKITGFGIEPGVYPRDAAKLAAAYQAVIDKYHPAGLDFDVEGPALPLTERNHVRNTALAQLQKANAGLRISYTLPVFTTGLDANSLALLADAKAQGVRVSVVNIMTMDYYYNGEKTADPFKMGRNAIAAADATLAQLTKLGLDAKVGLCPEIGQNDPSSQPELFSREDAAQVLAYAQANPRIARLDFWSVERDGPCPAGQPKAGNSHCSGVEQEPYDFSRLFALYTSPTPLPAPKVISVTAPKSPVTPGTPAALHVFAYGAGPISYEWFHEGNELRGANSDSYFIHGTMPIDTGTYTVRLKDANGTTEQVVATIALSTPAAPAAMKR